jgi:hypothetical protein
MEHFKLFLPKLFRNLSRLFRVGSIILEAKLSGSKLSLLSQPGCNSLVITGIPWHLTRLYLSVLLATLTSHTLTFSTHLSPSFAFSDSKLSGISKMASDFARRSRRAMHLTSQISYLTSQISYLTSQISHLTSHISHLTSHISHLTSHYLISLPSHN